jgi:hypothetical protein
VPHPYRPPLAIGWDPIRTGLGEGVYVSFGNLDAKLADNCFDLLPGQPMDLTITSAASLDDLKAQMKVISLTDAFAPHTADLVSADK